ncbi:MAG: hypothetical protein U0350_22120 [Caldilineaceae bacterium]
MATYSLDELRALWAQEKVSTEQMAGYLLQNLIALVKRLEQLEKRLDTLEQGAKPKI